MTASSPCIKLCRIDGAARLCLGCWRTLDEIAAWGAMPESERLAVMARLPERRTRLATPPPDARA